MPDEKIVVLRLLMRHGALSVRAAHSATGPAAASPLVKRAVRVRGSDTRTARPTVVVEAAPADDDLTTKAELASALRHSVSVAQRLREVSDRFGTDVEDVLGALTALALATPADTADPAAALSEHDEEVLREAGSLAEPMPPVAERASTRTALAALALLRDALSVNDAASRLGVTPGRVRQRLTNHTLLGVETSGGWKLPAFQFAEDGEVRGLDAVLPALPANVHPLVVQRFLTTARPDLNVAGEPMSPLAWLAGGGDTAPVVALAEDLHAIP